MTWNYSGDPSKNTKDEVRFLIGDTCEKDKLVDDEEIDFALGQFSVTSLASALVLRSLASKFSRMVTTKVGDISRNCSDMAKAFAAQADVLDPDGQTIGGKIVLPSFGGLSLAEKEVLESNDDAVQPSFSKGMDDIPGGPEDIVGPTNSGDLDGTT